MSDYTYLNPFTGETEDRSDSVTVTNALGAMTHRQTSAVSNPVTGLGTERDPSSYTQINFLTQLDHHERINLYRGSQIARNIVLTYPLEFAWPSPSISSKRYSNNSSDFTKIQTYFEDLKTGSLSRKVRIASAEARLHGESWLLLGINDARKFDKPLDEFNIISFDWVEVFSYDRVKVSDKDPDIYEITLKTKEVILEEKRISQQTSQAIDYNKYTLRVHKSRLLKFIGDFNPPSVLDSAGMHESCLQAAYDGLSLALQGIMASNAMLQDHSLFWYKLDGLSQLVKARKTDELVARFLSLQMSKSVLKGLALDARNEDAGFFNRSYGGVDKILEVLMDYMVSQTGMVRYKVLGTSNREGLGAEGRGLQERLQHSQNLKSWVEFNLKDNLVRLYKLGLSAQNSPTKGKIFKGFSLTFPPVLELTPVEIADLTEKNVNWSKTAIDAGMLKPLEARVSLFGSSEIVLNPVIALDQRVTDQMTVEIEKGTEPTKPQSNSETTAENLESDDTEDPSGVVRELVSVDKLETGDHVVKIDSGDQLIYTGEYITDINWDTLDVSDWFN